MATDNTGTILLVGGLGIIGYLTAIGKIDWSKLGTGRATGTDARAAAPVAPVKAGDVPKTVAPPAGCNAAFIRGVQYVAPITYRDEVWYVAVVQGREIARSTSQSHAEREYNKAVCG